MADDIFDIGIANDVGELVLHERRVEVDDHNPDRTAIRARGERRREVQQHDLIRIVHHDSHAHARIATAACVLVDHRSAEDVTVQLMARPKDVTIRDDGAVARGECRAIAVLLHGREQRGP